MIGKTLAHYEIIEKLGAGGMGEVYRARDTKLGREVALKLLPPRMALDPERRQRFEREARAIAALKHPNIVTIYSAEQSNDLLFITMELMEGQALHQLLPSDGFSLETFFEHAIPLTDAVRSAHEQGITHRDLKPSNLMLDRDGRLKVLDFGLAKLVASDLENQEAETIAQSQDTQVGQILGTATYMSPEQAEGKRIDHRSDIFSLGIVFYEMLTGRRPFQGETYVSTISSILKDNPPTILELKKSLPRHLGRIIGRCLEKNPDRRYQSAKDLRNELEGLKAEIDSGQPTEEIPAATTPTVSKKPRSWIQWSIVGAIIIAAIVMMRLQPFSSDRDATPELDSVTSTRTQAERTPSEVERKMAVVLPFENLGPPEDAYFAAGMTEEITSRLASVSGLGVISRTSATQYDRTGKTMKQIGSDLGVDYVLEGTVRWAKTPAGVDRVRITPQLIRVSDDSHLWADTYDREMDDIFDVQSEIAGKIIEQLDVTLLAGEQDAIDDRPTQNLEAYQAYLRAKEPEGETPSAQDRYFVEQMQRATELDPAFLEAWADLSQHHSSWYTLLDRTDARLSRAKEAMDRAIAIDSNHPVALLARGYFYYFGYRDYDRALEDFRAALAAAPNDADARGSIGLLYRRQGKWEESLDNFLAAAKLDPRNPEPLSGVASLYEAMRRFEEAVPLRERIIALRPDDAGAYWSLANNVFAASGDLERMNEIMDACPPSESESFSYRLGMWAIRMHEGDHEGASTWLDQIQPESPYLVALRSFLAAITATLPDGPEGARDQFETAAAQLEEVLEVAPGNASARGWLGIIYAYLGREEEAIRETKMSIDLTGKDRFTGPRTLEGLAQVYALTGRPDEAVEVIERLLTTTYDTPLTIPRLRVERRWGCLRDEPRFQALLNGRS